MIEPVVTDEIETNAAVEAPPDSPAEEISAEPSGATSPDRVEEARVSAIRADSSDPFENLRYELLHPEQEKLHQIQERLDNPKTQARELSQVLPRAIQLSYNRDDKQLTTALTPTVVDSIDISVRTEPTRLKDILYPIIGPAIRAAVQHRIAALMQSLNQTLNHSLTAQGWKWRMEAWQTGKQFGEVVLLHTLKYRVDQVFLIHRQTSLLLEQALLPDAAAQDPHLVSSMLSAIQDFVRDSFNVNQDQALEKLDVGDLEVWIEQGPHAVLAAVIRGNAPEDLRLLLQEVLENIHQQQSANLEQFQGDASDFVTSRPELERCLQAEFKETTEAAGQKKLSRLLYIIPGLLLLLLFIWAFFYIRDQRRWNAYLTRLRAEPGIVLVDAERRLNGYSIYGLRDPLAKEPTELMEGLNLDPSKVQARWEPYIALAPQLIEQRARKILNAPESVALKYHDGTLSASGQASSEWLAEARQRALLLPGVTAFQSELDEIEALRTKLKTSIIQFAPGSSNLDKNQQIILNQLADLIRRVLQSSQAAASKQIIEITGHADNTGTERMNQMLRPQRAEQVRSALIAQGISADRLILNNPSVDDSLRAVTFRLIETR